MFVINQTLALGASSFTASMILILSVIPPVRVGPVKNSGDMVHIAAYLVLAFFLAVCFFEKGVSEMRSLVMAILIAFFYGAFIEIVQYFIPYRSFGISDMFMNLLGAALSCVPFYFYKKLLRG